MLFASAYFALKKNCENYFIEIEIKQVCFTVEVLQSLKGSFSSLAFLYVGVVMSVRKEGF
jgi:hypothetical protein